MAVVAVSGHHRHITVEDRGANAEVTVRKPVVMASSPSCG
jgi:hypothetical protein